MGKGERGGRGAALALQGPALHRGRGEESSSLDPQRIVKLWKKGKRKAAHEDITKVIERDPTPVALTARTWMLYLEWDDVRSRSGGSTLPKLEELAAQVLQSAAQGVAAQPSSITCAEISLTTQMQLLEVLSREEGGGRGDGTPRVEALKHDIGNEADRYLLKDTDSWCDPSEEHYTCMQSIDQRTKDSAKARVLLKLEKFREYKARAKPMRPPGYSPLAGLDTPGALQTAAVAREANIEHNLDKLRTAIKLERRLAAAQRRGEAPEAVDSRNPKRVQQFLQQHNGGQVVEQQAEAGQQEQRRRGRGGRGRSGAVEEARLEMSRNKKESKDRAAREERMRKGEEIKQFLHQVLPQDKDERATRFMEALAIDFPSLKAKAAKLRDKAVQQRVNAHLLQLQQHGVWHFYNDLAGEDMPSEQCFKDVVVMQSFLKQEHLPGNLGELYKGDQMCCHLPGDRPQAHKDKPEAVDPAYNFTSHNLPLPDHPMEEDGPESAEEGCFQSTEPKSPEVDEEGQRELEEMGIKHESIDAALMPASAIIRRGRPKPRTFDELMDAKMGQYANELLDRFTMHFIEHLNCQDVLEDFQDLQPEESVYLRRWNDAEVAHFQQNGFWSARNLPENHVENYTSIGEQLVTLSRSLKSQQQIKDEQNMEGLSPDKAVELQGRLNSIEQDIQLLTLRLRGVPDGTEEAPAGGTSDDGTNEGHQQASPIMWQDFSLNDDIQLRPQYMQASEHKAKEEMVVLEFDAADEDTSDEDSKPIDLELVQRQHLVSDIWDGLGVIEENQLLTEQMLEAVTCYLAAALGRDPLEALPSSKWEGIWANMGHVPSEKLERLRTIVFQHLGLRGRVLGEFYLRTQQEEESNLAVTAGYEKDDADDKILRFNQSTFDLTKQRVLEQQTQQLVGEADQTADSGMGAAMTVPDASSGGVVPTVGEEELELQIEAAILEDMYLPQAAQAQENAGEDARSELCVTQYRKYMETCKDALLMLQGDLDERAHLRQIIVAVEKEIRDLQPLISSLQANTEEAAAETPVHMVSQVLQRLRANESLLKEKLEKWNFDRFTERIKFHEGLIKDSEENIKEIDKDKNEIHQAHANEKGILQTSAAPAEVQESLQSLNSDRDMFVQRHHNHSRHRSHAQQQFKHFQSYSRMNPESQYDVPRVGFKGATESDEDVSQIANTFPFPDPSGSLPGLVTSLHEAVVDRLLGLRQALLDISAHAEALLVKARQNVVNCLNLSFHRPPAQLQAFIRELVCEGLERFMREHKAKEAQEQEARLLRELEEESSQQKAKEEKEKKKKKSKAKKGKKKDTAEVLGAAHAEEDGQATEAPDGDEAAAAAGTAGQEDPETEPRAMSVPAAGRTPDGAESQAEQSNIDMMLQAIADFQGAAATGAGGVEEWETPAARKRQQNKAADPAGAAGEEGCWPTEPPGRAAAAQPSGQQSAGKGVQQQQDEEHRQRQQQEDDEEEGEEVHNEPGQNGPPANEKAGALQEEPAVPGEAGAAPGASVPAARGSSKGSRAAAPPAAAELPRGPVPGQSYEEVENKRRPRRRKGRGKQHAAAAGETAPALEEGRAAELPRKGEIRAAATAAAAAAAGGAALPSGAVAPDQAPPQVEPLSPPRQLPASPGQPPPPPPPPPPATALPGSQHIPVMRPGMAHPGQAVPIPPHMMHHPHMMGQYQVPNVVTPMPGMPGMPPHMMPGGYPYGYPHNYVQHMGGQPVPIQPHGHMHQPHPMGYPMHGMMMPQAYTPPPPPAMEGASADGGRSPESDVAGYMQQMLANYSMPPPPHGAAVPYYGNGSLPLLPPPPPEVIPLPPPPPQPDAAAPESGGQEPTPAEAALAQDAAKSLQEQEEADMEAAIAASLQDVPPPYIGSRTGSSVDMAQFEAEALPQLALGQDAEVAAGVGLMNGIGEYNCFLNVIVQCLWHLTNFRKGILACEPLVHDANPVIKALFHLFQSFHEVDMLRHGTKGTTPEEKSTVKRVVSPTELREALSAVEGQQIFRLGEMNDAAEVLGVLWGCMHDAHEQAFRKRERSAKPWRSLALVDEMFGLEVHEVMSCSKCHKETRKADYVQHRQTVPAMALRLQHTAEPGTSTGHLIRAVLQNHQLPCDPDEGGCGRVNHVCQNLRRPPGVLTLELAWATERTPAEDIEATLAAVDDVVDLGEIYTGLPQKEHMYRLRSMVCYYGAHYQAFVMSPNLLKWLIFDDESIGVIGTWEAVKAKCLAGRIQPSVLFFERER